MLRIVVLRCPTLNLRWTASGTCCATLLQRCKQAAWRHLEAANCHVFRHRWKTLDSGLATLASVWQRLDNAVQRWGKYNIAWSRCTTSSPIRGITSHINISLYYHFDRNLGDIYIYITNNHKKHDIDDNRAFVLTFQQAQIDSALHQYGAWYAR